MSTALTLKRDILIYNYDSSTSAPSADFKTKIGFSSAISGMSVGTEYTMYISNYSRNVGTATTISDTIDLLDGVKSDKKDTPVKGSKTAAFVPSAFCTVTNRKGRSITFDVGYDTEGTPGSYDDRNFKVKIIDSIGSGNFRNGEGLYFTYNYYGSGGNVGITNGGEYQINSSQPSSAADNGYVRLTTSDASTSLSYNCFT